MHLFRCGHVKHDIDRLKREFPGLPLTFFSAQKSEHGNKIVKLLMRNLYGLMSKDGNENSFDFIINDHNLRIIHYLHTCTKIGTQNCSKCKGTGHNCNNKKMHP